MDGSVMRPFRDEIDRIAASLATRNPTAMRSQLQKCGRGVMLFPICDSRRAYFPDAADKQGEQQ
jgi:hypothetical protein